ncbi:hypothetical protein Bca4012_039977 [Brassica carinata]
MDIGPPPIDSGESQPQLKILSPTNELPPTSLISSMALNQTSPPADLAEDQINVAGTINGGFIDASGQDRSRNSVAAIGPISVNNGSGSDSNESATVASGGHLANTTCVSVPMGIHEQTIPGIGAWSKPLNFISNQSATTLLMQTTKDLLADLSSESQWPSLATASHSDQRRRQTTCAGTLRPPSSKDNAGPAAPRASDVHSDPSPLTEASKSSVDISIDSQGCILLDQETNDLMPSNIPTKALVNNIGVNVESPLRHSALMETETIPLVSSQNSTCTIAPTSEVLYLSETALLSPIAGLNETFTTSTIVSSTLSTPLHFTAAVDLEPKLGGLGNNSKQLSDVKGSNRFANLALMEEELASDDISSPSHTLLPATVTTTPFVFNSPVPSSPSSLSDGLVSQVEKDDFGTSFVAATSNSSDMAQRSRVGRCLKPSQKLKDMEWFTIGKKGRRGRGSAAAGRLTH